MNWDIGGYKDDLELSKTGHTIVMDLIDKFIVKSAVFVVAFFNFKNVVVGENVYITFMTC